MLFQHGRYSPGAIAQIQTLVILQIDVPRAWFNTELSHQMCGILNVPKVKASEWLTLENLYRFPLPPHFKLLEFAEQDKIHAVMFITEDKDEVLIHPKAIYKIANRQLKKLYSRAGSEN